MTSGAALADRATPPDLIEEVGGQPAPRPAANAGRHPSPVSLAESDRRRDQASPPRRPDPDGGSERYLAPALKAAAAARARSARIRADALATRAQPDAGPARRARPPAPAARDGWSVSEKAAAAPAEPPAPAAGAGRRISGLSVAAAARASTIAFQPVRRPAPPASAATPADLPAPAEPTALAAPRARAPEPEPPPAPAPPPAAQTPAPQVPAPEPARQAGDEGPRFARTLAESRRSLAASGAPETGSGLVPRPTLPLADPEPPGRAWLRLWSRR